MREGRHPGLRSLHAPPFFSGPAVDRIVKSKITEVVARIPSLFAKRRRASRKLKILSVAELLAAAFVQSRGNFDQRALLFEILRRAVSPELNECRGRAIPRHSKLLIFLTPFAASQRGTESVATTSGDFDFTMRSTAGPEKTACVQACEDLGGASRISASAVFTSVPAVSIMSSTISVLRP